MDFSIRFLKESDYDVLCKWWKDWRWQAPPRDFLPENGCGGLMVSYKGRDIFAGFIYFTNSAVCWSEFIVSDFSFKDKDIRNTAVNILIKEINAIAKEKGCKYIYTVLKNQSLKKTYQEIGFLNGSIKADEMVMVL